MNSSSTLVATVSINYEDFTEGFLTCGTCLITYDQAEHTPKLLSCSHTICQSCLELIASSPTLNNNTDAGCIKCPICRQNIVIPTGGISALPPSFIVNQLYDLVNKKPREFIPKCSIHFEQELLFCETCDCVFCDTCNSSCEPDDVTTPALTSNQQQANGATTSTLSTTNTISTATSSLGNNSLKQQQQANQNKKQHINETCTVIPFSTAIKRMSEILNYRSQQCSNKLDEARDNVQREVDRLESNCTDTLRDIKDAFERLRAIVEDREKQLIDETNNLLVHKKNVLLEQLKSIEDEKQELTVKFLNCSTNVKINNETDVKNLSKKITDLTEKNDIAMALFTPRENCFINYENNDTSSHQALMQMQDLIGGYGKIKTSKTYPPYCTSKLLHYSTNLKSCAQIQSIDYNGAYQTIGGDPIQAELRLVNASSSPSPTTSELVVESDIEIRDNRNGTYEVWFVPPQPGKYQLHINIFNRPIKNNPLQFETGCHHNPVAVFGSSSQKGLPDKFDSFNEPASLVVNKHNGRVYVLDSFNKRIKCLAQIDSQECPFSFMHNIQSDNFGRSCTGIALLYPDEDDVELADHAIQTLSLSPTKQHPPRSPPNILVTDWRSRQIYELNQDGKLLREISHDDLVEPTNICVDSRGRIFVVNRDSIFVFNSKGKLLERLTGYRYHPRQDDLVEGAEDIDSIKKMDMVFQLEGLAKKPASGQQQQLLVSAINTILQSGDDVMTGVNNNKENKRPQSKTGTLASLISIRRKPKMIMGSGSSLQRGSKAVISAASKIKSTFTLSHSTSLVSAVSLQSMFVNSNKLASSNNTTAAAANNNANLLSSHGTVVAGPGEQPNNLAAVATNNRHHSSTQNNNKHQLICQSGKPLLTANKNNNLNQQHDRQPTDYDDADNNNFEPFGIIRAIAIGPDDDLIVADESRVRILSASSNYAFERELRFQPGMLVTSPASNIATNNTSTTTTSASVPAVGPVGAAAAPTTAKSWHHGGHHDDRLCAMTYDNPTKKLLLLYTNFERRVAYIQIVDYRSGKPKFVIDSHESKLIRPTSLATFGQHVIVTDMASDCIKKYRFY